MRKERMTSRERFHATFRYQHPSRIWLFPQWTFRETRQRWLREGMPWDQHFNTYWGFDRYELVPLNTGIWPPLEQKVIETGPGWNIVEDELGGRSRVWTDRELGMPQWIQYPVRDRETWAKLKQRLDPDAPVRYPEYWDDHVRAARQRDFALGIHIGSYYGWIRNWVGMENLALWYYDQPGFVHEITEYVADFILRLIDRALNDLPGLDFAHLWEDMAMKTGPLIGPNLFREFMMGPLTRVTRVVREAGIDIISVDSDGNNDVSVPLWLEAGVNLLFPLERAAGTDPVALRQRHGRQLLLMGGIDKRVLREGCSKAEIDREIKLVEPLIREGGFTPWVDHAVPPDVPFANFRYMNRVFELATS